MTCTLVHAHVTAKNATTMVTVSSVKKTLPWTAMEDVTVTTSSPESAATTSAPAHAPVKFAQDLTTTNAQSAQPTLSGTEPCVSVTAPTTTLLMDLDVVPTPDLATATAQTAATDQALMTVSSVSTTPFVTIWDTVYAMTTIRTTQITRKLHAVQLIVEPVTGDVLHVTDQPTSTAMPAVDTPSRLMEAVSAPKTGQASTATPGLDHVPAPALAAAWATITVTHVSPMQSVLLMVSVYAKLATSIRTAVVTCTRESATAHVVVAALDLWHPTVHHVQKTPTTTNMVSVLAIAATVKSRSTRDAVQTTHASAIADAPTKDVVVHTITNVNNAVQTLMKKVDAASAILATEDHAARTTLDHVTAAVMVATAQDLTPALAVDCTFIVIPPTDTVCVTTTSE